VVILKTLENTTFRKLDLFPSSGDGGDTYSVGSLRKSQLHLRTETSSFRNVVFSSVIHHRQNPLESNLVLFEITAKYGAPLVSGLKLNPCSCYGKSYKKFWEDLIAYFP
jgi:hypothetical protein